MTGQTVSHYELLEELGRGGMGVVYKARDLRLERLVALKFLPPHLTADPGARERFLREARAASALDEARIVTVHEIGEAEDGRLFLCMAFYPGETLDRRIARGPLPVGEARRIAAEMALGLARAHEAGIVHRDIKPGNVLITERGDVKILDFGLAKLAGQSHLTVSGAVLGTAAYMSPEQARGEPTDERTDLWSLGAVLYEMLAGHPPFAAEHVAGVLHAVLAKDPEPLSAARADLPAGLAALVDRLLAKDRELRPASAAEVAQAVGRSVESDAPTLVLPRVRARPRRRLAAAGLAAAALAAALAWQRLGDAGDEAPPSLAVLPFVNSTGDPALDYVGEGLASALISRLSALPRLSVAAPSEVWSYRGRSKGARDIGRELGVASILEARLFAERDDVRLDASLTDTGSGTVLWAESLRHPRGDLSLLEEDLLAKVAGALLPGASGGETATGGSTRSQTAYDLYLRGRSVLDRQEGDASHDSAAELFRAALEDDPRFALARAGLAEALASLYDRDRDPRLLEEAEREARRGLEAAPGLPACRIALAQVLRRTGRVQEAIAELRRLVALHPELDAAYVELAFGHRDAGDLPRAEASLREAVALRPSYWGHWNELGGLLMGGGAYDAARQAFEQAAEMAPPEVLWPLENLGNLEVVSGDYEAAVAAFERIPGPVRDGTLASNVGTAYFYAGRLEEAGDAFRLAVRLAPKDAAARRNLADLYQRQGKREAARREYLQAAELVAEALAVNPGNSELHLRYGLYLGKAGACDEAMREAREAERELPPLAAHAYLLAQAYAVCGERDRALSVLALAVERGYPPENLAADDEFGDLRADPEFRRIVGGG